MTANTQKRTKRIQLANMRKSFALKPLIVGMTGALLGACSEPRTEAQIYTSVEDCIKDNPSAEELCRSAYKTALDEAARTGPRFATQNDCEYEFGANQCRNYNNGGSFFVPFMAGYLVSNLLSPDRRYYSQPMYTSYSRYSPNRARWIMADGYVFDGDIRKRNYKVRKDVYKPKPTVNRTIKRGGFGSSVKAKSSWGSSRSGSWGG